MACDGLRVVLVVSEWPGLGLASGHARPRQARPGQAMAPGRADGLVLAGHRKPARGQPRLA